MARPFRRSVKESITETRGPTSGIHDRVCLFGTFEYLASMYDPGLPQMPLIGRILYNTVLTTRPYLTIGCIPLMSCYRSIHEHAWMDLFVKGVRKRVSHRTTSPTIVGRNMSLPDWYI